MRPGLPEPLINLLGARWALGAPAAGLAWFGEQVGFGLVDGTLAIARARSDGAATMRPRKGGGVELVPATAPPPPVMRAGVHVGPCLCVAGGDGRVLSGGLDGLVVATDADGAVETLASFPGARVECAAVATGAWACAVGPVVHRFGPTPGTLELPGLVTALAFDPAGGRLAATHSGGLSLWSAGEPEARVLSTPGSHGALAWSADGRHLVSALDQRTACHWDLSGDGERLDLPGPVLSASHSAPGAFFALGGASRVVCWHLDGTSRRTECGVGSSVPVAQVACHPTRAVIAAGYGNGAVLLCQPGGSDTLFVRAAGGGGVTHLAWYPDGAFLALAAAGGEVGVVAFPDLLFRAPETVLAAAA